MYHNHKLGAEGERVALEYMVQKGYRVRDLNWRYHHLEVDLVVEDDDFVVFVEVKTRSSVYFSHPEEAVGFRKMLNLSYAAEAYMAQNKLDKNFRFDILAIVVIGNRYHFKHIEDAFMPPVEYK